MGRPRKVIKTPDERLAEALKLFEDEPAVKAALDTLDTRTRLFVCNYIGCGIAAKSALDAGFGYRQIGNRLLKDPGVIQVLRLVDARRLAEAQVTAGEVLEGMRRIAFADPADMVDEKGRLRSLTDMPDDVRMAISSFKVNPDGKLTSVELVNRSNALLALGKHLHMFSEHVKVDVSAMSKEEIEAKILELVQKVAK